MLSPFDVILSSFVGALVGFLVAIIFYYFRKWRLNK